MPKPRTLLLAGAAALLVAGSIGLAKADPTDSHVMTVQLPDGAVARISYRGDVPPTVTLAPEAAMPVVFAASPFAMLERISQDMDRAMARMWPGGPFGPATAAPTWAVGLPAVGLPAGGGFCMRSVSITQQGTAKPQVVTHQSGDCGGAGGPVTPSLQQVQPEHRARTIEVKSTAPGIVQRTNWRG